MFHLKLLGSPRIEGADGVHLSGRVAQRHRLALLSLLALSGSRGSSRDRLMALLWPESDSERARNLLKVSVYVLRQALGDDALLSDGDVLRLNPERVDADVTAFEVALAQGHCERAVDLYRHPFLDGFHLQGSAEFERWVEQERSRLAGAYARALETLAALAEQRADPLAAVEWWKTRAAEDPYDSRVVLRLMQALEASGNPAGALQQATLHEALLSDELGIEPAPELLALTRRLRAGATSVADIAATDSSAHFGGHVEWPRKVPEPYRTPFRLQTLGGLVLHGPERESSGAGGPDALVLALLAVLAAAGGSGVSRDRLLLLFWPDASPQSARESLDRLVRTARSSIDDAAIIGTDLLRLNAAVVSSDIGEIEHGPTGDPPGENAPHPAGLFLDGFDLNVSPEFEEWLEAERDRLAADPQRAAVRLASAVERVSEGVSSPGTRASGQGQPWLRPSLVFGAAALSLGSLLVLMTRQPSAEDVAESLARRLAPRANSTANARRPASSLTRNAAALERYDLCSHTRVLRTDSLAREALECLREATDLDPTFAAAWAELALLHLRIAPRDEPDMSLRDRLVPAEGYALKATVLDPSLAEAHRTLGLVRLFLYRFDEAESDLERALELDPDDTRAYEYLVHLHVFEGRFDRALERGMSGIRVDPLSPTMNAELARAYLVNGLCDEALAQLDRLRDLDPPVGRAGQIAAECYGLRELWAEAISVLERAGTGGEPRASELGYYYARAGRQSDAERLLGALTDRWRRTRDDAFGIALVHWGLGRRDSAFTWLDRSIDDHSFDYEIRQPRWEDLRGDPRFERLLVRVGLQNR